MFKIYSGINEKPSALNPPVYSFQAIHFLDSSMVSLFVEMMPVFL